VKTEQTRDQRANRRRKRFTL